MRQKRITKKIPKRKSSTTRGYISFVLMGIALFGFLLASGFINSVNPTPNGTKYNLVSPTPYGAYNSLELHTLSFISVQPTIAQTGNGCQNVASNDEPEILVGFDPGPDKPIGAGGKIRVWVSDERPPLIAPNELVDAATGLLTPGTRTASDGRGAGYYLWEPSIYITALTPANVNGPFTGDAELGGKPYFPTQVKGDYNNQGFMRGGNQGVALRGPAVDSDFISFENGPQYVNRPPTNNLPLPFLAEYIWDVNSFGLTPGGYRAEFVIHDGDVNLGIDCVNIQI